MELTFTTKQEILSLILADMRNRKLIIGLEDAGLRAQDFYTSLSELVMFKIGFKIVSDELQEWYDQTLEDLIDMEVDYFLTKQHDLTLHLYDKMILKKLMIAN